MADPFHELNSALRDQEKAFTKRELMAMHFVAARLSLIDVAGTNVTEIPKKVDTICNQALMAADLLLEKVRNKRA